MRKIDARLLEQDPSLAAFAKTKTISVRLTERVYEEIKKIAIKRDLSINQLMRIALQNELGIYAEDGLPGDLRKTASKLRAVSLLVTGLAVYLA